VDPARRVQRCLATIVAACAALVLLPSTANAATFIGLASGRKYMLAVEQRGRAVRGTPVLIVLHGMYNTSTTVMKQSGFNAVGSQMGWSVVYGESPTKSWNAGRCCGGAVQNNVDDVGYLVDVVKSMRSRGHYGPVYLAGFSNGGMMALRAGCEKPLVFSKVASVSGTLVAPCASGLRHARHIHGTKDTVVPYYGGWSNYCKTQFDPVEQEQVGPSIDYQLVPVAGGVHAWPPTATPYLRDFFAGRATTTPVTRGGTPING
jgi:poly(3-hydroxybutyrate) depolymerase